MKKLTIALGVVGMLQLVLGVAYLLAPGALSLSTSAFPMFNAILIAGLLFFWMPRKVGSGKTN